MVFVQRSLRLEYNLGSNDFQCAFLDLLLLIREKTGKGVVPNCTALLQHWSYYGNVISTPSLRKTRRIWSRLDVSLTVSWMWMFHFKLLWIVSPRTLWEVTSSKCGSTIFSCERFGVSLQRHTRISLHFFALNFTQLSELLEAIMSRVDWMEKVLVFVSPSDKDASSTYYHIEESGFEILRTVDHC